MKSLILSASLTFSYFSPTVQHRLSEYLPMLKKEWESTWPSFEKPSLFAAQVEQETCLSLKHPHCWDPHVELKTNREYGFGLGQLTITKKFNGFKEAQKLDIYLSHWQWKNRYDPHYQLHTLILTDKKNYQLLKFGHDSLSKEAMMLSAYNGGLGSVLKDRLICSHIKGCNPTQWFGHIEKHSLKSKKRWHGYGQSAYEINRGYVKKIIFERTPHYVHYFDL